MISNIPSNFALNRKSTLKRTIKMIIVLYAIHIAILILLYLVSSISAAAASIASIILLITVYPINLIGVPSYFYMDHLIEFSFVSCFPLYSGLAIIYAVRGRRIASK